MGGTVFMIYVFTHNPCKTYRTERFCTLVDHNIVLSVETDGDGGESKTCYNIGVCKKKNQCRYLSRDKPADEIIFKY